MNLKLLHIFLLSTAGTFLLCTPFINTVELANGLVTGKMCWFHLAMLFFSVCVFFVMLTKKGTVIAFTFSDPLVLFFAGGVLITYKWNLNPEPEKLIFAGQLVILWFLLRYVLTAYREFKFFFLFVLMFTGLIEAVWGMQQLHGYSHSNHSLFRLTGSFFNPGPYSGYIAVILPVCLWTALRFQKGMHYFAWICVGAILIVLPAGMSRSAWMAAVVACGWVYWTERIGWKKTKAVYIRYKNATIPFIAIVAILAGCTVMEIYELKRDSADGRLLMWKVTTKAIAGQPLAGTGLGGFPAAYAEAQGEYFATGTATGQEKQVAGEHGVLWDPEQAAWGGRRRVGVSGVCGVVLSVAVAVVLDDTGVFGGDMRDERWDAGKIIRLICVISVPYNYNKPVVACIRLPVHLAERAI